MNFGKLKERALKKLSSATKDLFHFIVELAKLHNIRHNVHVYMLEDQIHKIETDTCAIF